jgi:protein SCO1/2
MIRLFIPLLLVTAPALAETQRISIPDLPLTDHADRTLHLPETEGTVVLSFMFTTCNTLCPVTNALLAELDDRLQSEGRTDVTILSITLDPTTDRPEVLALTADTFNASPQWHFLTGPGATDTAQAFGMSVYDIALHDPVIFIGTPTTGQFLRSSGNPGPDELLAAITRISAGQ